MRDIQAAEPRVPVLATLLILLLVMPTAAAAHMDARITDDERDREGRDNPAESTGSLSFDIEKVGHRYPVAGNDDLYSLTSYLSALGPSESSEHSSESTQTSGRQSCNNRHVQGDVVTIPYPAGNAHSATGNVDYEVVRIATPSVGGGEAAILVEQAVLGTFSETDRTNMANEWANTIWPDVTSVFQLSSSLRDADDNCQIQVVLTTMDGGGGTGGYFWSYWEVAEINGGPTDGQQREAIFVDIADAKMAFGNFILSHELQHFLLHQEDTDEVIWLNEGLADHAGWLVYRNQSTYVSDHFNHWMDHPEYGPLTWLDGRTDDQGSLTFSDYGFSAAMNLFLWDRFDDSITTDLFQEPSNGIASVEAVVAAADPSKIGSTWNDFMANFTASSLIDEGDFSYAAIDFQNDCSSSTLYCSLKVSEQGNDWSGSPPLFVTSGDNTDIDNDGTPNNADSDIDGDGQMNGADSDDDGDGIPDSEDPDDVNNGRWSVENWGVRAFHLTSFPGDSDLNLNITTGDSDWEVRLLVNDTSTGWELRTVSFDSDTRALTTVAGLGSNIDQLYVIGWYASAGSGNNAERRCYASWSAVDGYVGVWDSLTSYSQGQRVEHNDLLYGASQAVPAGIAPAASSPYWSEIPAAVYNKVNSAGGQLCPLDESWIKVTAGLSTDPPSLAVTSVPVLSDGDGDAQMDTMRVNVLVTTDAFESNVDLLVQVQDGTTGALIDSLSSQETPMVSQPYDQDYYFTAKADGDHRFRVVLSQLDGTIIQEVLSDSVTLSNMKPVVSGEVSGIDNSNIGDATLKAFCENMVTACVETWADLTYSTDLTKSGDAWGLRIDPSTYIHVDEPSSYLWNFGDGNKSILRSGAFAYRSSTPVSSFNTVTLNVTDSGGAVSDFGADSQFQVAVIDVTPPVPRVFVGATEIVSEYYVRSEQRVRFDAERTSDNVPSEYLQFSWDWGDGESSTPLNPQGCDVSNCMRVVHTWPDGSADGQQYTLTLTVSDGTSQQQVTRDIFVLNRPPAVLSTDSFRISTLSQLPLSPPFEDIDGEITQVSWQFQNVGDDCTSHANVASTSVLHDKDSTFNDQSSMLSEPFVAWKCPGQKRVIVSAIDDDGNQTSTEFFVEVINQPPIARLTRSDNAQDLEEDVQAGSFLTFFAADSEDLDASNSRLTYRWYFEDCVNSNCPGVGSDGWLQASSTDQAGHQFSVPGRWEVRLVVNDTFDNTTKSIIIAVSNPSPIAMMQVREAWYDGVIATRNTPENDWTNTTLKQTFTSTGAIFISPGTKLYMSSYGSRDGDARFDPNQNASCPCLESDISDPRWNGLTQYRWDFGDSSPPAESPTTWHVYDTPGEYTLRLLVRDAFGTGDTSVANMTVLVNTPPELEVGLVLTAQEFVVTEPTTLTSTLSVSDPERGLLVGAWRDNDIQFDLDGDGVPDNDPNEQLIGDLVYSWDLDDRFDVDGDGNYTNDGDLTGLAPGDATWSLTGYVTITVTICDQMGECTFDSTQIQILGTSAARETGETFDFKSLVPESGDDGLLVIGLVILVGILGWMVMRQRDAIEVEASQAEQRYSSSTPEGGVLGMDQHSPPPVPKSLNKDERTDSTSGYVRPAGKK